MDQPKAFIQRPDPDELARCMAIRYTGEPANVQAIKDYAHKVSGVLPSMTLELIHGSRPYLIVATPSGRLAVAVPGNWLVWEGNEARKPWVQGEYAFRDFYQEAEG